MVSYSTASANETVVSEQYRVSAAKKISSLLFYSSLIILASGVLFSNQYIQIVELTACVLLGIAMIFSAKELYIPSLYFINIAFLGVICVLAFYFKTYDISIILFFPLIICNRILLKDTKHFWILGFMIVFSALSYVLFVNLEERSNGYIIDGVLIMLVIFIIMWLLYFSELSIAMTENKEHSSLEFLQKITDLNPHQIYAKSKEGKFIFANKQFANAIGQTKEEIIGKTDFELGIPKSTALQYVSDDIQVMDSGEQKESYIELLTRHGDSKYVQSIKSPFTNEEGEVIGVLGLNMDRSVEKKHENELSASKLLYQTLFDNLNDAVLVYDYEKEKICSLNNAAMEMFKFSQGEDLSKYDRYNIFPESFNGINIHEDLATHKELILNSQPIKANTVMLRATGELFECKITVYPTPEKNAQGVAVIQDVSLEKRQDERYKFLFENAFDGIAVSDAESKELVFCNNKFKQFFELDENYQISQFKTLEFSPEIQDNGLSSNEYADQIVKGLLDNQAEKKEFNWKFKLPSGEIKYADISLLYRNVDGENHVYSIYKNTTGEQLTQKALRESEKRFRLIFDNAFDGLYFFNYKTQKIVQANQRLFDLFETTPERILIDKPHLKPEIQPDGQRTIDKIHETLSETLRIGKSRANRIFVKSDGTTVHLEISAFLLSPPDDDIIVSIYKDISDQKRAEDAHLVNATQGEKLDALGRELSSYTLFTTQKNKLLQELSDDLKILIALDTAESKIMADKIRRKIADNLDEKENWISFKVQFERVHPGFFNELENKYAELTTNDLKHCAYVKMGLSNAEIAEILFVGKKAIEMSHYRLKKKMGLVKGVSLKQAMKEIGPKSVSI